MDNNIVNLENNKKQQTVYTKEKNFLDSKTGEILTQETTFVKKETRKDHFIKMFVENIIFWIRLDNKEKNILLCAILNMNWFNIFRIDPIFRKMAVEHCEINRNLVSKAINSLIKKNVFIKIDEKNFNEIYSKADIKMIFTNKEYIINPQIVGKGSFRDLKKMRQTVITDYDFDTLEMKSQVIQEAKYDGFDEIINSPEKFQVKEARQEIDKSGKFLKNELVISELEDNNQTIDKNIKTEKNNISEKGLKELDLAILEAENEKLKLELELLKIKSKLRIEK